MRLELTAFASFSSAALLVASAACNKGEIAGSGGSSSNGVTSSASLGTTSSAKTTSTTSAATMSASSGTGGGAPACVPDAWATYGHDAARTFATNGCVTGPLTAKWSYKPTPQSGKTLNFVSHVIAATDGVYLHWAQSDGQYLGTTAVDRIGLDGSHAWTFDSGTDSNLGHWDSIWNNHLVVNDDGVYLVKLADGTGDGTTGVDSWGMTIPDPARLYLINDEHVDGPGIYVGAVDATLKSVWQANTFGSCRIDGGDIAGGIALDKGVLYYAPTYSFGTGPAASFVSGVYAFDGATGAQAWTVATTPWSPISAGHGNVFLMEQPTAGMYALVARKESDGSIAWQQSFASAGGQAPVLAGENVIVAHDGGVVSAFDAATGAKVWDSASVSGAQGYPGALGFSGGCVDGVSAVQGMSTTLAAALASATLVVSAADGIHLLSLTDGKESWSGAPAMSMAPYHDPVIVGDTLYVMDASGAVVQMKAN